MTFAGAPDACPCGSGTAYADCCAPLHQGTAAPTAEALMRSRYTAYSLDLLDYVFRTWHPRTRPDSVDPVPGLTWTGLQVLGVADGGPDDETGVVEFRARFTEGGRDRAMHETSRFERRAGRWVYVDGTVSRG